MLFKKTPAYIIAGTAVLTAALLLIFKVHFWWSYALWLAVLLGLFCFAAEGSRKRLPLLLAIYAVILLLCILFPNTGDDWLREPLGRSILGIRDLAREVGVRWGSTNSRISGNVLAYSAASRKVLRELMRSAVMFGVVILAVKEAGLRTFWGVIISATAVIAVPRDLFRQAYPWAAGFFNYVPPVLFFLLCLHMVREIFQGREIPKSPLRILSVFLLGFASQLFIETYTICFAAAGFMLLAWDIFKSKRLSPVLAALCIGNVLGGILLFSSPAYSALSQAGGAYHMDSKLSGLISTAMSQLPEVLRYFILDCPVLFISLTVFSVFCMIRSNKRAAADVISAAALAAACVYFIVSYTADTMLFSPALSFIAVFIWLLALAVGIIRWTCGAYRLRAIFSLICAVIAVAPLPFITPIGMRCVYLSYVLLLITSGNLLASLGFKDVPMLTRLIISVGAAAVLGFYLRIYIPTAAVDIERNKLIACAIESGEECVEIPPYPYEDYLWEPVTDKIQQTYYNETPGDLKISTVK